VLHFEGTRVVAGRAALLDHRREMAYRLDPKSLTKREVDELASCRFIAWHDLQDFLVQRRRFRQEVSLNQTVRDKAELFNRRIHLSRLHI
jgi:hypothetical protein